MPRRSQRLDFIGHDDKERLLKALKEMRQTCAIVSRSLKIGCPAHAAVDKLMATVNETGDFVGGRAGFLNDPWHSTVGGFQSNSVRLSSENGEKTANPEAQPPDK